MEGDDEREDRIDAVKRLLAGEPEPADMKQEPATAPNRGDTTPRRNDDSDSSDPDRIMKGTAAGGETAVGPGIAAGATVAATEAAPNQGAVARDLDTITMPTQTTAAGVPGAFAADRTDNITPNVTPRVLQRHQP
jgi:hypothetical protein